MVPAPCWASASVPAVIPDIDPPHGGSLVAGIRKQPVDRARSHPGRARRWRRHPPANPMKTKAGRPASRPPSGARRSRLAAPDRTFSHRHATPTPVTVKARRRGDEKNKSIPGDKEENRNRAFPITASKLIQRVGDPFEVSGIGVGIADVKVVEWRGKIKSK
jgi:hypothetical protein